MNIISSFEPDKITRFFKTDKDSNITKVFQLYTSGFDVPHRTDVHYHFTGSSKLAGIVPASKLTSELTDNDGWRLLIQLADNVGRDELKAEFESAHANEEEHLIMFADGCQNVLDSAEV